ncbi:MAG: Abi family protein [Rikenellaceae bacterium]|jgi:abortive infection bacteriophage resistance protein|nr:Abi family protein [Rikenellaceae bacterium]
MQNYTKQCTLPADLVPILKGRGLAINDEPLAVNYLTNIGYFRLSAYLRPLLKEPKDAHTYKEDATFEKAMNMYRFDRKLRLLLFNEIEKIEVAVRSALVNLASHDLGTVFWMTDSQYFHDKSHFDSTLALINSELGRTKEDFILHFKAKYSEPYPPVWMIAEILPLGVLTNIYRNLASQRLKKQIASHFGLTSPAFESWVQVIANLRNLCGHHSRVWNRESGLLPADLAKPVHPWIDASKTDFRRVYCRICMVKYILFTVSPNNCFTQKIKNLIAEFPTVDPGAMGFPADWETEPLWMA